MPGRFDPVTRLRVWSPLSPHEESFVEQIISDAQSQLDEISSHTQHMGGELRPLGEQYEALDKVVYVSRGLRAPIRTLPLELLSEVFAHCTDIQVSCSDQEDGDISDSDSEAGSELALRLDERTIKTFQVPAAVLCQVCTTWNSIVSISTLFWSRISLSMGVASLQKDDGSITEWATSKLAAALVRSGESPLHATMSLRDFPKTFISDHGHTSYLRPVSTFLEGNYRWRAAELKLSGAHVIRVFKKKLPTFDRFSPLFSFLPASKL